MKRVKHLLFLAASVMFVACSSGGDEISDNDNPQTPNPPSDEVVVEDLPSGVEIGAETQQLNNIQLEYLVGVDSENTTLTFSSSLDEGYIPHKDEILLQYYPTDKLPYGFLGRVTNVTTNGNSIIVETEAPTLGEAFEELCFSYDIDIQPATSVRALVEVDDDGYLMINPEGTLEFPNGSVGGNIGVGGKITVINDLVTKEGRDKSAYKVDLKFVAGLNAAVKGKWEKGFSHEIQLLKNGLDIKTTASCIGLKLTMYPSLIARLEGEAGCRLELGFEGTHSFKLSRDGDSSSMDKDAENINAPSSSSKGELDGDFGFYLDGSLFIGIATKFEVSLFGRKEIKCDITPEFGQEFSATLQADFAKLGYTAFKDNQVATSFGVNLTASGDVNILDKWEAEWEFSLAKFRTPSKEIYLFPEFKDGSYSIDENNKANGSIGVERDLFFQTNVAIGQYDANGGLVEMGDTHPYKKSADLSEPLSSSFTHKDGNTYWSAIKWGKEYLKCVELEEEEFSLVGTWSQIGYQYHDPDYVHENYTYKRNELPWIFNADGTGIAASIEGEQEEKGYNYKDDMYWEYPINNNILKLTAKDPELYGEPLFWKVIIKNNNEIELLCNESIDGGSGNWYEIVTLIRESPL